MHKLIIHATNIHYGGGGVLLNELIKHLSLKSETIINIDKRMELSHSLPRNLSINRVEPTIWGRLKAEYKLKKQTNDNAIVLCFGNLPPLLKVKGNIFVFIQNRFLIDKDICHAGIGFKQYLKLKLEKTWLFQKKRNSNHFIVQSNFHEISCPKCS